MASDILKIPNLIAIGRILLILPTGWFLSQPGVQNQLYAFGCLVLAAASDSLDGYLARRLNQQTRLGLILDPLADKIVASVLVLFLILYRDFPIWMAIAIIGRDLLILSGSLIVKSKTKEVPSSSLMGKYCFTAIAVLLVSYVIRFDFGIDLFTPLTIGFICLSLLTYGRSLIIVMQGQPLPVFNDRPIFRMLRTGISIVFSAIYIFKLAEHIGWL